MIYQRHMPASELFAAQLELLLQHSRVATIGANLLGLVATVLLFWQFLPVYGLFAWALGVMVLILLRASFKQRALRRGEFHSRSHRVYALLLLGALLTGLVWSGTFIVAARFAPPGLLYVLLLCILLVNLMAMGMTMALREYFLVQLYAALLPIGWWCLLHHWDAPWHLLIGLLTLALCGLLLFASDRVYRAVRDMLAATWERATMAEELARLADSLRERNHQLADARRQLVDLANIDELTGLGNRRLVNRVLQEEINRARRSGGYLAVVMLDVDHFKPYNDTYGHDAGDKVLQQLAEVMRGAVSRAGELAGRYGGEEFILVLPGADPVAARRAAERLRDRIHAARIPHGASPTAPFITVSQGVAAEVPTRRTSIESLVKAADLALYRAKAQGRDRVEVAEGKGAELPATRGIP